MTFALEWWGQIENLIHPYWTIIRLILIILISFLVLSIILRIIKKQLLKKVKSKKQASNVTVFLDLLKYVFAFLFILIVVFTYYNNWGELGFVAGLLTVAIGWALQKPISGVVAWLIIISGRPIQIGDRIIIDGIKGEITNITLTHIFLDEIGGTIDGEELSGRTIMVPNSIIFEGQVTNYTLKDEYILEDVKCSITYESNLKHAEEIVASAVDKIMNDLYQKIPKKARKNPNTRINFSDSGVEVTVRFLSITDQRNRISTDVRREIHKLIIASKDVEFAYPHTEVLFRNKKP